MRAIGLLRFGTVVTGTIVSGCCLGVLAGSGSRRPWSVGPGPCGCSRRSLPCFDALLVHGLKVDSLTWLGMRTLSGFAYAGSRWSPTDG